MLNIITIGGRLTKDPELRYTQSEKAVATFTLAVDRDFVTTGEQREADFFSCVAWGKTAEFVSKYFRKGETMYASGRLQNRSWEKDGQKHTVAEVIVSNAYFGGGKKSEAAAKTAFAELKDDEDEIPF